ncbi:hypothetical protein NEHOM01_2113 [Nematocida homosporus]|uniref:uncharacterized protein n=1 Tax=Nematocida homosporus TaxID=1912981 RepID=UPI002220F223|nr:uncharacterized protein NEHOM01_2113 [Nematocida homosporus]KAI5187351.1 hypothetical protein NEHOM01_2113 [Nematocida homosporus]
MPAKNTEAFSLEIGQQIVRDFRTGNEYCDLLSRNVKEIGKIEQNLKDGILPEVFKLHSKVSIISPKSVREMCLLLEVVDLKVSKLKVWREIVERVVGYPLGYLEVKTEVLSVFGGVVREYVAKHKRLEQSLFKGAVCALSRSTKAFATSVLMPWVREGMTGAGALVMSRVVMKSSSEREYMEWLLRELMGLGWSSAVYALLLSILIKKLKLSQEVLAEVKTYLVVGCNGTAERVLSWHKLVLVVVRGYSKEVDLSELKEYYGEVGGNGIEEEIRLGLV